jgi:hypothetical protein
MRSQRPKACFTPADDEELVNLVTPDKETDWTAVARRMRSTFTPRQCRERWKNYLHPQLKRDSWSADEDQLLLTAYRRLGNRWTALASALPGRSAGVVRNRVFLLLRKKLSPVASVQSDQVAAPPTLAIDTSDKDSRAMDLFATTEPARFCDFRSDGISPFYFSGL